MAGEKKATPAKASVKGKSASSGVSKRKFGTENKVTTQGNSQFSRPEKSKKNWKRGVKKYRGQGR